jgi:hypothetical protein
VIDITPDIKRKDSESNERYLLRIGDNKDTLGLSWQGVADLMNESLSEDYGESKWRKDYYLLKKGFDLAIKESVTENELLREIQDQTIEAQKVKFQVQDQRRLYTNEIRQQSRIEHLIKDELYRGIIDLANEKPLNFSPPSTSDSVVTANVLWSDWHVGSEFSNSLNRYNIDIFRKRLEKLVSSTIAYGKKHNVGRLTIGALGDFISGAIHVSTRVQSSEDVIRQIQIVAEALAESIAEISKHFNRITFINIIGNHSRVVANKTESIFRENLEYIIPWYLESRLKEFASVDIHKDDDGIYIDERYDEPHIYIHGDLDHVSSVAKTLPQMLGFVPRYIFCGHIHHDTVKEFGRTKVISNGSMIGIDDYAIAKRFYAEPMHKMHIFDGSRIEYTIDILLK